MYPDPNRIVFGPKTLLYMGHDMSHYLGLSGIMPILIPDLPDPEIFKKFLDQLDGFIFQGGLDINPESYGETPENYKYEGDPQRDIYELKIMDYAFKNKKPVLGICRGMQLLNVFCGGTLYQDIETHRKEKSIPHVINDLYDEHTHEIEFAKNSLFEKIHGVQKCMFVNSVHHQGIKKLGDGLQIEALCREDGLVEGVLYKKNTEDPMNGKALGIQWHPEFFHTMENSCMDGLPVLNHFISLCSK